MYRVLTVTSFGRSSIRRQTPNVKQLGKPGGSQEEGNKTVHRCPNLACIRLLFDGEHPSCTVGVLCILYNMYLSANVAQPSYIENVE